ncbi:inositol polyphosphate 1-phosphatase-like [Dreissena polymorpha]|uniref:Inositol polyphosphate 1-phosphatase n=1 Tax=Dreissena polymorpha TaxID=45954 RepID=A0A9D4HHB7_DREPO|nr:inositol polyphosphate 1-phosphatase-like [Dreissena polymorpha]XP_052248203.1 inositol polyphosphate 1-phosphatase-like [Dreissena polymorpha]KAH3719090.1 hypothetical protein DPMN_061919 [Dreissena polymorpha]
MKIHDLLRALISVSEKGANIARIIRSESSLLELLVQEKKGNQKNERFVQDFKTLADVLVQEVVRYDLKEKFPGLVDSICGEESNKFTNTLGDSVIVQIQDTPELTKRLLCQVLDDNETAASVLADVIHREVVAKEIGVIDDQLAVDLQVDDLGVWIDPIDSTAQYIQGDVGCEMDGLVKEGLQCVAVLIGVYLKSSGLPIMGVINQPFCRVVNDSWIGSTTWGVCFRDVRVNSLTSQTQPDSTSSNSQSPATEDLPKPTILISSSEDQHIQEVLSKKLNVRHVTGAGYKLLGVCMGRAVAYLLTKNTNFKWDCCGPHAVLLSLGGGIVKYEDFEDCVAFGQTSFQSIPQIKYHKPDDSTARGAKKWMNVGGIIAYSSENVLTQLAEVLQKS